MRRLVIDCETDGLDYTELHCIVAFDLDAEKYFLFVPQHANMLDAPEKFKKKNAELKRIKDFPAWASGADEYVMHNGIAFDAKVFSTLLNFDIPLSKIVDTLILSRLVSIERASHSVAAYGQMFGVEKPEHEDWSKFSWDMLWRCVQDVRIQTRIYGLLREKMRRKGWDSPLPLALEQAAQKILLQQTENGFYLNPQKTFKLFNELEEKHADLTQRIRAAFPTRPVAAEKVTHPKKKKDGSWYTVDTRYFAPFCDGLEQHGGYTTPEEALGGDYTRVDFQPFNIDSPKQRVDRLLELGWEPSQYSEAGNPVFNEESLEGVEGLPEEAQLLGQYLMVASRMRTVRQWIDLADGHNYVHGKVITIGARTHRAAHREPNMANVPRVKFNKETKKPIVGLKGRYGYDCRACWEVEDKMNEVLLGCDASGIQLRALAHYANNAEYTRQVCEGDVHQVHADVLGVERETAKTFIYAWLLNAGAAKIGQIIGGSKDDGASANRRFVDRMPFLGAVKRQFEAYGGNSDYKALDGRYIFIPTPHLALATGLQSFEAIVMKWVMRQYHLDFKRMDIPFKQRNWIHDEFQITVPKWRAEVAGEHLVQLFADAGVVLGSNCPLTGEYKIGTNWAETH